MWGMSTVGATCCGTDIDEPILDLLDALSKGSSMMETTAEGSGGKSTLLLHLSGAIPPGSVMS